MNSQNQSLSTAKIHSAVYVPYLGSLFIRFDENLKKGYDSKEYVEVDKATATEYRNATDKDNFYQTQIKGNFKFRYTHHKDTERYLWQHHQPADPLTYEEYMAIWKKQQDEKDQAAFNALNK